MTSTPSTILDPVTGLPLDQYSGIIQQIPLGSQVFPFEDLNADGRMTRQPIYGDDILPTSALVVGQDTKGQARAGTMDSSRRLYTREAVYQNLGQPIPDGETAPVDVNVVSGGGGGSGPISPNWQLGPSNQIVDDGAVDAIVPGPLPPTALLYSVDISAVMDPNVGGIPLTVGYGSLFFSVAHQNDVPVFYLGSLPFYWNGSSPGTTTYGRFTATWPLGLSLADMGMAGGTPPDLVVEAHNGPYRLFGHWMWKV